MTETPCLWGYPSLLLPHRETFLSDFADRVFWLFLMKDVGCYAEWCVVRRRFSVVISSLKKYWNSSGEN